MKPSIDGMLLSLWFSCANDRSQLVKVFQSASTHRLGFLKVFIKHAIGILPRNGDHRDPMLLFDLLGHVAQLLAANMRSPESLEAFAIIDHRLDRLQSVTRLGFYDPH